MEDNSPEELDVTFNEVSTACNKLREEDISVEVQETIFVGDLVEVHK